MAQAQTSDPHFTPGPWTAVRVGDDFEIRADEHVTGLIGRVLNPFSGTGEPSNIELEAEETEADARVIAAAPRLFEALAMLAAETHRTRPEADSGLHTCRVSWAARAAAEIALRQARGEA